MTTTSPGGEEAIIRDTFAALAAGHPGAFGLSDDCAVITPPPGFDLVVKTDPVREGVHFLPTDPPDTVGWKALAVNVSDLIAKGASPHAYTLALSFPAHPSADWLARFRDGLAAAQAAFGCHLIGGDTDRAPGPISIAVTAFGLVPAGRMVRRGAARPGDLLYVSGTLGDAALGLPLARGDACTRDWPIDDETRTHLIDRYRRPSPRLALAPVLLQYASAAMDISDGLAKDIGRMARASSVGVEVDLAVLPISAGAQAVLRHRSDLWFLTWAGGDDYEVLCTVPAKRATTFEAAAARAKIAVSAIGNVTDDGTVRFPGHDEAVAASSAGWDHF